MSSVFRVDSIRSTNNTESMLIDKDGNIDIKTSIALPRQLQNTSAPFITFIELTTPAIYQVSFSGAVQSSITITQIPTSARYILADVFITANAADHFGVNMGRQSSSGVNWVATRGNNPGSAFSDQQKHFDTMFYMGDADGYSPNFGLWFSSRQISTAGQVVYYGTPGVNSTSTSGYIYLRVRGYSI